MADLHDEIQTLGAVLEVWQREARHGHKAVLRLAASHLRLLAREIQESSLTGRPYRRRAEAPAPRPALCMLSTAWGRAASQREKSPTRPCYRQCCHQGCRYPCRPAEYATVKPHSIAVSRTSMWRAAMCPNNPSSSALCAASRPCASAPAAAALRRPRTASKSADRAPAEHGQASPKPTARRRYGPSAQAWRQAVSAEQEALLWQELLPHLPENVRQLWLWLCLKDGAQLRRVLEHYGGQELAVPRTLPERRHPLARALGMPCLRKLMALLGGTRIYVPRCARLLNSLRQRDIITAFSRQTAAGQSSTAVVARLARKHGLTDRRIWQILKEDPQVPAAARLLTSLPGSRPHQPAPNAQGPLPPRPRPECHAVMLTTP